MKFSPLLLLLVSLILTFSSGCAGYRLGAQKPVHLRHVTKLAVPTFQNLTLEPRLAVLVTNAVIKQLQNHGSYQIVSRREADAVLEGQIHTITRSQFRSDRNNILRTSQIQAALTTNYIIRETTSGTTLHNSSAFALSNMIIDANMQLSETQLLEDVAQRLAANVADEISEGW